MNLSFIVCGATKKRIVEKAEKIVDDFMKDDSAWNKSSKEKAIFTYHISSCVEDHRGEIHLWEANVEVTGL